MTGNLRATRDLGEIIADAYRLYTSNVRAMFLIALVVAPWEVFATVIVRQIDDASQARTAGFYLLAPGALIALVATGGIMRAVRDVAEGVAPSAGSGIDAGLQKFWPSFVAGLISGLHIVASLVAAPLLAVYWLFNRTATIDGRRDWYFALIPLALTTYLFVRWTFVQNAVVIEDKRGWEAIDDSADAVRGQWWRAFGATFVIALFRLAPSAVASVSVFAPPLADGAFVALGSVIILPFVTAAQTLLYYDLKARNAHDLTTAGIDASKPDVPG